MREFKYFEISLLALLLLVASLSLCLDLLEEDDDDLLFDDLEAVEDVDDLEGVAVEEGDCCVAALILLDVVVFFLLLEEEEEEAGAGGGGGAFGILDSSIFSCLSFALLLDWFDSISFGFLDFKMESCWKIEMKMEREILNIGISVTICFNCSEV